MTTINQLEFIKSQIEGINRRLNEVRAVAGCRAYLNGANQTIPTGTWTKILFDKNDDNDEKSFDINGDFDADGVDSDFTVPVAGVYSILAGCLYQSFDADKQAILGIFIDSTLNARCSLLGGGIASNQSRIIFDRVYLTANQVVDIRTYHNTGTDETILAGSNYTWVSIWLERALEL